MTTLPSFDQLVSTLGVDTTSRPRSSSTSTQHNLPPARSFTRSRSNSSLKMSRYAPYSPTSNLHAARRRSSISSSCSSPLSSPDLPESRLSPLPRRRKQNPLTINVYGESPTERRDAPISAYVRRKTPGASPVSATFDSSRESSPAMSPMPFLLPTLPTVLPPMETDNNSQRTRDHLRPAPAHLIYKTKSLTEMLKGVSLSTNQSAGLNRARRHTQTGVRISSPAARAPANTHHRHGSSHTG
ncbi:hypothetical protein CYLTODRAFT_485899 [Cylindrobasidium torrendii FP15055 ss-10]|uniref:Uncharacterized protein n=1 Tax=Cylindrobasidium torrendii FP15055 ss-10 TaxID=1314674 RepID=A0A0D7BQW0_9AGAR|nr:hypothetical protein CYLTODRAFT_485899 [Cylindrobasidium torrendii FP15055 ss-10]